jgi:Transposase
MLTIGIDTHKATLAVSAIDGTGRETGARTFPNDRRGHVGILRWAQAQGSERRFVIEGSGSYGAALGDCSSRSSSSQVAGTSTEVTTHVADWASRRSRSSSPFTGAHGAEQRAAALPLVPCINEELEILGDPGHRDRAEALLAKGHTGDRQGVPGIALARRIDILGPYELESSVSHPGRAPLVLAEERLVLRQQDMVLNGQVEPPEKEQLGQPVQRVRPGARNPRGSRPTGQTEIVRSLQSARRESAPWVRGAVKGPRCFASPVRWAPAGGLS